MSVEAWWIKERGGVKQRGFRASESECGLNCKKKQQKGQDGVGGGRMERRHRTGASPPTYLSSAPRLSNCPQPPPAHRERVDGVSILPISQHFNPRRSRLTRGQPSKGYDANVSCSVCPEISKIFSMTSITPKGPALSEEETSCSGRQARTASLKEVTATAFRMKHPHIDPHKTQLKVFPLCSPSQGEINRRVLTFPNML